MSATDVDGAWVIHARWIIDGVADSVLQDHALVVQGSSIGGVVPRGDAPPDAPSINLGDATVLPGLIDCHVHLPFDGSRKPSVAGLSAPQITLRAYKHAQIVLRSGVTTVRDVGCPQEVSVALRDAIDSGDVEGPRIVASGRAICITGGHGSGEGVEADGPAEMRKAVRGQLKAGADWIKLMGTGGISRPPGSKETPESVQILPDELVEAATVSHGLGHRLASHAEGAQGIRVALEASIDTIEHGNHLNGELAGQFSQAGATLIPTVSPFRSCAESDDLPDNITEPAKELVEAHKTSLRAAQEHSLNVACGTDSGTGPFMDWRDHYLAAEVKYLVDLGNFTPMDAIKSATSKSAKTLGVDNVTGSLTPGKIADIIAVRGDLLADLNLLRQPILVVKEGATIVGQSPGSR